MMSFRWTSLSAGGVPGTASQTCGVATDGLGYCWGSNATGQLGRPGGSSSVPVRVAGPAS